MLIFSLVLLAALFAVLLAQDLLRATTVPILQPATSAQHAPVSVIVPARNEALRIGRLLDGLERQTSRNFELVVLDDHSTDGTADIVQARAGKIPGLHVLRGKPLPQGWSGKCWACWQAAEGSTYSWLLFLDADTAPAPELIATLLARAEARRLDFLTLFPLLELESFWERLLMPPFAGIIQAAFPLNRINDPRSPLALANGQCILIRRDVYLATGGHAAVRASVLEDVQFAQVVKGHGYRIEIAGGPELMRVRMYTNLAEISEGLRKNAWAGYSAGGWRSAWGAFRQALLACAPLVLIFGGGVALALHHPSAAALLAFGGLLYLLTTSFWGYSVHRLFQISPLWGLIFPLGTLGYFILAALAWLSIRRGAGVRWKGRAYHG